jgi:hypothetical protein
MEATVTSDLVAVQPILSGRRRRLIGWLVLLPAASMGMDRLLVRFGSDGGSC